MFDHLYPPHFHATYSQAPPKGVKSLCPRDRGEKFQITSENDTAPFSPVCALTFREDLGSGIGGEVENYCHRKIEGGIRVQTRVSHFQGSETPYGRLCRGLLKIVQTTSENDTSSTSATTDGAR